MPGDRQRRPARTSPRALASVLPAVAAALLTLTAPAPAALGQDASAEPYPYPGVYSLGAETGVYTERFDAPVDWIELGKRGRHRARLDDGWLVRSIGKGRGAVLFWDQYRLPASVDVIYAHASVSFAPENVGAAGVMCSADGGLPRSFVAGINAGSWWLGRLIDGRLQVVTAGDLGELAGRPDPEVAPVKVAIECAGVPESGGDYVQVLIDDQPVGVGTFPLLDIPVGPYDRAGILVGTDGDPTTDMSIDDFTVYTGDTFAPLGGPLPPGFPGPSDE